MGEGDYMPVGGHRRKADPAHAQAIKKGGEEAERIRKRTIAEHQQKEVPQAENELLKDLKEVENNHLKKATK